MTRRSAAAAVLGCGLIALAVTGCVGEPEITASTAISDAPTSAPTPTPAVSITPFPLGQSMSTTALPANLPQGCRDILTDSVLAELEGVPLNADGMGGGIRADGSRVCVWGDPGAVATHLVTVLGYSPEREARDALYALSEDGFTCYEPSGGIRCEKTWAHPTLPVQQGRTLFYRDGVIIDTQYTNLAPAGYTDAIIAMLWRPGGLPTSTPSPTSSPTPAPTGSATP